MTTTRLLITFATLLLGVLVVIGLAVPIAYGPSWEQGARVGDGMPMCLRLSDGQPAREAEIPSDIMLLRRPTAGIPAWYDARFSSTHQFLGSGAWRAISPDSIEIRWHHSPSIRLSVSGNNLSGVVEPAGVAPLFFVFFERRRPVRGAVLPCPEITTGPDNELSTSDPERSVPHP